MKTFDTFLKGAEKAIEKSKRIMEDDIEDAFCEYAKSEGCYPFKLALIGLRGFPDRTILCPGGRILFIEFKRKGKGLSPAQSVYKKIIVELGFKYFLCDEIGQAERKLRKFLLSSK